VIDALKSVRYSLDDYGSKKLPSKSRLEPENFNLSSVIVATTSEINGLVTEEGTLIFQFEIKLAVQEDR